MPDLYSVAYIAEIYGPGAIIFAADLLQFAHKKSYQCHTRSSKSVRIESPYAISY